MAKAAWRIVALSALLGGLAPMASAQMVVGGDGRPSVEVNWGVLESLGQDPNLAAMLRNENHPATQAALKLPGQQKAEPQFRPFKSAAKPAVAKPAKPKPAKVQPVAAKAADPALAELVQATRKPAAPAPKPVEQLVIAETKPAPAPAPVAKPAIPPKPQVADVPVPTKAEPPKPAAGPQVALPEVPAPKPVTPPVPAMKAEIPAPAPVAKAEPAPAPAPVAAPAPAPMPLAALTPPSPPAAAPAQVAAVAPSAAVSSRGDTLTLSYAGEDYKLPESARTELNALAKRMNKDEGLSLQLMAFASGDEANASKARRLSVSRAIEVRKYLLDQGVRTTRIEMRALGNKNDGAGSPDRVDVVLVGH